MQELPQYKSHKVVQAAQITEIHPNGDGTHTLTFGNLKPNENGVPCAVVDAAWMVRNETTAVGGYYVQYADAYTSYSPTEAFEEGYTPIQPNLQPVNGLASAVLDVPEAIRRARYLLAHPEMLVNEAESRRIFAGMLAGIDRSACVRKALEQGLDVFALLETDMAAPGAIVRWVELASANGCGKEKINDALATFRRWDALPNRKWPD